MKIKSLTFKNINNLKGEHSISFDKSPLSHAGIFAIVGPTGSGKSTILDVITLALFNRIPRFKNKTISKNQITNEGSVLTHHTTEAEASIEYEIKGLHYKSSWSVATNRNGKLKDYEMSLYLPDGSVADLKKSEVPGQNEKIIGLNYDQFIKSILLSQGEFSKFLKADKNDRGKLLEKITGTSIYRQIGVKAFLKYKEVKENLEREKDIIGVINILSDNEREALISNLNQSKIEKEKTDLSFINNTKIEKIKSEKIKLKKTLQEKENEAKINDKQILEFQTELSKLDLHSKISHVRGPLTSYNTALKNKQINQEKLNEYEEKLKDARSKFRSSIKDLEVLTQRKVSEENFKKVMNDFELEINNADRDLQNLGKNGKETRARINKGKLNYPISIDDNIKPKEAIDILTKRAIEINSKIKSAQIDTKTPVQDIRSGLKQKQDEVTTLKILHEKYLLKKELTARNINYNSELEKLNTKVQTNNPLLEKCKSLVEASSNKIELLIKQKEDAIKIAKLEDLRDALINNEACPLCGSLEHPYTKHLPKQKQSEIDSKIDLAQNEKKIKQEEFNNLNSETTACLTSISHIKLQIRESNQKSLVIAKAIEDIIQSFEDKLQCEENNIEQTIKRLSEKNSLTELAIEALTELNINKELILQFNDLKKILSEYLGLKRERDSKFKGTDVNLQTNRIQDNFEANKSKITELKAVIKKEKESLKRERSLIDSIALELNPKVTELGFSNINELSIHILDEVTVNNLTAENEKLKNDQIRIKTEIESLQSELYEKIKFDSLPDLTLESLLERINKEQELIQNHQKVIITNQERLKRDNEDRSKVKLKEKAIEKLVQELEKWAFIHKMIGDAHGHKFSNFAQGLTLQNLLAYANRRLSSLSDRYLLDKPENDGSLIVVDKYQGNISRSVTTLSGGESFLISLALALALSDMASKNVALECLFIDEGFGTLDPESLESALNTLEKLQSESQKTVGVISHVEALKERIDVQIKLKKNAQGYSQIEVFGHNQNQ